MEGEAGPDPLPATVYNLPSNLKLPRRFISSIFLEAVTASRKMEML
jgi:hypothetical protein